MRAAQKQSRAAAPPPASRGVTPSAADLPSTVVQAIADAQVIAASEAFEAEHPRPDNERFPDHLRFGAESYFQTESWCSDAFMPALARNAREAHEVPVDE